MLGENGEHIVEIGGFAYEIESELDYDTIMHILETEG